MSSETSSPEVKPPKDSAQSSSSVDGSQVDVTPEAPVAAAGPPVVHPDEPDEAVYSAFSRFDEEQILQEMQGDAATEMFYRYNQGGKEVVGLSYVGVIWCIRRLNAKTLENNPSKPGLGVHCPPEHIVDESVMEDGQWIFRARASAVNPLTGDLFTGASEQTKRIKLTDATLRRYQEKGKPVADDGTIHDEHAYAKVIGKAQRNALEKHIPVEIKQELIDQFMGEPGRTKKIAGAAAESVKPPLDDDRAKELIAQASALYKEVKVHAPGGKAKDGTVLMTPGVYHNNLKNASHSHDLLEAFIESLQSCVATAKEKAA